LSRLLWVVWEASRSPLAMSSSFFLRGGGINDNKDKLHDVLYIVCT
jgi:hypothetical protein